MIFECKLIIPDKKLLLLAFHYFIQSVRKERPPMHQYIRKILYTDLSKINTEKVLRQFRKLNWDDEAITAYAIKCFISSWNVRYYNIRCVANLLAGLAQFRVINVNLLAYFLL